MGGGSAIDSAKAIAILAAYSSDEVTSIWDFSPLHEKPLQIQKVLPIVAVTSTSGTGSHVTPFSVVTNPKTHEKPGIGDNILFPSLSIVDTQILSKMPPTLTANVGFDVLAHALEAIVSPQRSPITDIYALHAIELVYEYLPRACEDGSNIQVREKMALADTLAGFALAVADTVLPHALSHPVSGHFSGVSHGAALAILTPPIMCFNIERGNEEVIARYCWVANRMGRTINSPYTREKAMESVKGVEELIERTPIKRSLDELGVKKDLIQTMAEDARRTMGGDIERNPVQPSDEDLVAIYQQCFT
jgi:alcohol dehydrogenase class IV